MKCKLTGVVLILVSGMSAITVQAEPGERWEVTSKMDMAGMPFAMPAQTVTVCIPKGKQGDPNYSRKNDGNCKMTDIKQSGNTVKFRGTCMQEGRAMEMSGETTHDSNSFSSKMHMTGSGRGGDSVDMKVASTGKKLGGSCDTAEQEKAMNALAARAQQQSAAAQAQSRDAIAQACEVSGKGTDLIYRNTSFLGNKPLCAGKKAAYCSAVKKAISSDYQAFTQLQQHEQQIHDYNRSNSQGLVSIVQACGISMPNSLAAICKASASKGPQDFLDSNCPAEAKAYREYQRKLSECQGRAYTGASYQSDVNKCMSGQPIESRAANTGGEQEGAENPASSEATNEAIKQGTKALKGLFGF